MYIAGILIFIRTLHNCTDLRRKKSACFRNLIASSGEIVGTGLSLRELNSRLHNTKASVGAEAHTTEYNVGDPRGSDLIRDIWSNYTSLDELKRTFAPTLNTGDFDLLPAWKGSRANVKLRQNSEVLVHAADCCAGTVDDHAGSTVDSSDDPTSGSKCHATVDIHIAADHAVCPTGEIRSDRYVPTD